MINKLGIVGEFIVTSLVFAVVALGFGALPGNERDILASSEVSEGRRAPIIVIDAGHGGEDGGASSEDGEREKDLNLKVSLRTDLLLKICGIDSRLTRDGDEMLYDKYNELSDYKGKKKVYDLKNRLRFCREAQCDALVSIHMNKFCKSQYSGLQVYYSPVKPESKNLATRIQSYTRLYLQPENEREIKKATSSIFLLKRAEFPAVLVECGFLSNPKELEMLKTEEYKTFLSLCISSSIAEWAYSTELSTR